MLNVQAVREIQNSPELKITNIEQLPRGSGAKYLEVTEAHNGTLIAVRWRRKKPAKLEKGRALVCFV